MKTFKVSKLTKQVYLYKKTYINQHQMKCAIGTEQNTLLTYIRRKHVLHSHHENKYK